MVRAIFLILLVAISWLAPVTSVQARPNTQTADPFSLIEAVNNLRAANGLYLYQVNSLLMSIAQSHANYMAATGVVSHYGAGGTLPYQRALAAGYPVAGDLTQGGFFSENIMAGTGLTTERTIEAWRRSAPHLNTMLSPNSTEIGAGVSVVNGYVYVAIVVSRPAGKMPAYTPPGAQPGGAAPRPAIMPNTPHADGSVVHVVREGQYLWTISVVYKVAVEDIKKMNNMTSDWVYPGDRLLIVVAQTPTQTALPAQTEVQSTPTRFPVQTATIAVTETASASVSPNSDSSNPTAGNNLLIFGAIIVAAFILAVILSKANAPVARQ